MSGKSWHRCMSVAKDSAVTMQLQCFTIPNCASNTYGYCSFPRAIIQNGRPSSTRCASFEEAHGHCHHGAWTRRQVGIEHSGMSIPWLTRLQWCRMVSSTGLETCPANSYVARVSLAENWRRRGKFEDVKFIFPNAPSIPITIVCAVSANACIF